MLKLPCLHVKTTAEVPLVPEVPEVPLVPDEPFVPPAINEIESVAMSIPAHESTLNPRMSPADICVVVQVVKFVSLALSTPANVGFSEPVIVSATVGSAPDFFQTSITMVPAEPATIYQDFIVALNGTVIYP